MLDIISLRRFPLRPSPWRRLGTGLGAAAAARLHGSMWTAGPPTISLRHDGHSARPTVPILGLFGEDANFEDANSEDTDDGDDDDDEEMVGLLVDLLAPKV